MEFVDGLEIRSFKAQKDSTLSSVVLPATTAWDFVFVIFYDSLGTVRVFDLGLKAALSIWRWLKLKFDDN